MSAREIFRATVAATAGADDVDRDAFRETMGTFPTAVSVLTSLDETGTPRGLTCSAICSLSADPPLVLACVHQANGSLRAIRHSGGFVVNLLREDGDELSARFASSRADKHVGVDWTTSETSGLPFLGDDALAHVDCRLVADIAAGTHSILIGAIRTCRSAGAEDTRSPLVYWRRSYGCWAHASSPESRPDPDTPPTGDANEMTAPHTALAPHDQLAAELTEYVRAAFLDGDDDTALTTRSPLLEWGVLTSMNTALLLTHVRETYGVDVPPAAITAKHLRDTDSIAALVRDLIAGAG